MTYTLPLNKEHGLISKDGREIIRGLCTPMGSAKVGDVVCAMLRFVENRHGGLAMLPIQNFIIRAFDQPDANRLYTRRSFPELDKDCQARIALACKLIETTPAVSMFSLSDHTSRLLRSDENHYRLLLTSGHSILCHGEAHKWIAALGAEVNNLSDEQIGKIFRVIIPDDLTAHETIEMKAELEQSSILLNDTERLTYQIHKHVAYSIADLSTLDL